MILNQYPPFFNKYIKDLSDMNVHQWLEPSFSNPWSWEHYEIKKKIIYYDGFVILITYN